MCPSACSILVLSIGLVFVTLSAQAAGFVAPSSLAVAEGDYYFGLSLDIEYQQLYGVSQLVGLSPGDTITGMQFRFDSSEPTGPDSPVTSEHFDVYLGPSNFPVGSLTQSVAGNQGVGTVQVRSGPVPFPVMSFPGGSSPNGFGPLITFDTPYTYSGGALLLTLAYTEMSDDMLVDADSNLADVEGRQDEAPEYNVGEVADDVPGYALVTRFTFNPVPEPSTFALAVLAFGILGVRGRGR